MRVKEVRLWWRVAGFFVMLVGLAGLALPILPGWLLIFVGLELIGLELIFFDKIKEYAKKRIKKEEDGGKF